MNAKNFVKSIGLLVFTTIIILVFQNCSNGLTKMSSTTVGTNVVTPLNSSGSGDCDATSKSWQVGSVICTARTAYLSNGDEQFILDSDAPATGSLKVKCVQGNLESSTQITATCANPTTAPAADIVQLESCTIKINQSTCTAGFVVTSSNITGTSPALVLKEVRAAAASAKTVAANQTTTFMTKTTDQLQFVDGVTVTYGSNEVQLNLSTTGSTTGTLFDKQTVIATCQSGTTWNGNLCEVATDPNACKSYEPFSCSDVMTNVAAGASFECPQFYKTCAPGQEAALDGVQLDKTESVTVTSSNNPMDYYSCAGTASGTANYESTVYIYAGSGSTRFDLPTQNSVSVLVNYGGQVTSTSIGMCVEISPAGATTKAFAVVPRHNTSWTKATCVYRGQRCIR